MHPFTRREFVRRIGKGLLGAGLLRLGSFVPVQSARGQAPVYPLAAVSTGTDDDSAESILKTALEGIGGIGRFVKPGMTVAIKPNATWAYAPHTASSTDPELLRALIQMVRAAGAGRIIVLDHCSIDPGTAECLRVNGIGQVVKDEGVEGIFPDRTNAPLKTYITAEIPQGKAFQQLGVIKAATEADLRINLALAKTHNVTKMTMCMKHMMGFLQSPGLLHASLEQGIVDLSTPSPIHADLHILEALRVRLPYQTYRACAGPETDLTNPNVVRRWNQVVAGTDPVLMDAYGTVTYFDMQPDELVYLRKASEAGTGEIDIEAATQDGRLKIFTAGQPVEAATPTAVPATLTPAPVEGGVQTATLDAVLPAAVDATATPHPTATPLPAGAEKPVGIYSADGQNCSQNQVVDPSPFLNLGLIPAAMVVTGAGLVAAAKLNRKSTPPSRPEDDEENHARG